MSKIIICIHGLGNKPPQEILTSWWKRSIKEGLQKIGHPRILLNLKLVYWARLLNRTPLDPNQRDKDHPLFLEEPYIPSTNDKTIREETSEFKRKLIGQIHKQLSRILLNDDMSINFKQVTDYIVRRYFKDLDAYYSKNCLDEHQNEQPAKEVIRSQLAAVLEKHRKKKILLIAHSMGSIIAFDVLAHNTPHVHIHTFVTIGSPLGSPVVISKIVSEQFKKVKRISSAVTPDNITHAWYNLSDLKDRVALDYHLADDFETNSKNIKVTDKEVTNDYRYRQNINPHKAYGYLRTPEMAGIIHNFMNQGRSRWLVGFIDKINGFFAR